MAVFNIDPNGDSYQRELSVIRQMGLSREATSRMRRWLTDCAVKARNIPGGFVKKIVWDKECGYPEHAWGYIQYTVRPYIQGYGCDGTTDENIHLIAATLCGRLGVNYAGTYIAAYLEDSTMTGTRTWVKKLLANGDVISETVIPECCSANVVRLALADLHQINNRSLVEVLEERLSTLGMDVSDWEERTISQPALAGS